MTALEERQLKGVTARLIAWIIASTATVCCTALYTYFDFRSHFIHYDRVLNEHDYSIGGLTRSDSSQARQLLIIDFRLNSLESGKN